MIQRYHLGRAFGSAILYAIPFIVLPLLLLNVYESYLPEPITLEFGVDLAYLESLILTIGMGVVAMAFMTALYERGLLSRALFGGARQAAKLAWVYYFFNAGVFSLLVTLGDGTGGIPLESIALVANFETLLLLLYGGIIVMAVYFFAEYLVYRRVLQDQFYVDPSYY